MSRTCTLGFLGRKAIAQHNEAEGTGNSNGVGARIYDFQHAALTNPLSRRIIEPHPTSAGAAARCLPAVPRKFDVTLTSPN